MSPATSKPGRLIAAVLRLLAAIICFLALWIVIPGPTYPLLVLAVGAPEISPLLLILALTTALVVVRRRRQGRLDRIALTFLGCAILMASIPLIRFSATHRRFDAAMSEALGGNFVCAASSESRAQLRASPFRLAELLTGLRPSQPISITHDVAFASTPAGPLSLELYRPAAAGMHPIVVQVYGGAWQRGTPRDDAAFAGALASAGYVVAAVDYRHAPRWQFPAQLDDIDSAVAWIRRNATRFGGDTGSIILLGRSSGAELAVLAAFRSDSTPVRAVVSFYGPVDLAAGYRHPPVPDPLDIRAVEIAYLGGTPEEVPAAYRAASPIAYVRHGLPPALLIYGARDHVVEPRFGRMLRDTLATLGDTAILLEIPWSEHAFDAVPAGTGSQLALYEVERFLAWATGRPHPAGPC